MTASLHPIPVPGHMTMTVRFQYACPICKQQHTAVQEITLPASDGTEYDALLKRHLRDRRTAADMIARNSTQHHDIAGDLETIILQPPTRRLTTRITEHRVVSATIILCGHCQAPFPDQRSYNVHSGLHPDTGRPHPPLMGTPACQAGQQIDEGTQMNTSRELPYLAIDLESADRAPEGPIDPLNPPGITCIAAWAEDEDQPRIWHAGMSENSHGPRMTPAEAARSLDEISALLQTHTLITWNGTGFDLPLLAHESGQHPTAQRAALAHIDMMFHIFAVKGWPIALDTLAQGMGFPGKSHDLTGAEAPALWAAGEHSRVIEYCAQDAHTTLQLALAGRDTGHLAWRSRSGRHQTLSLVHGWMTLSQAMATEEPDTSWMDDPIPRERFTAWLTGVPAA